MRPDLDSLALFLRAVECGSLSKAAAESHMVLSAASRRIAMQGGDVYSDPEEKGRENRKNGLKSRAYGESSKSTPNV